MLAALAESDGGKAWLAELEISKDPWFNYSSGTGFYHHDKVWMDNLDIPFGYYMRNYIEDFQGRQRFTASARSPTCRAGADRR